MGAITAGADPRYWNKGQHSAKEEGGYWHKGVGKAIYYVQIQDDLI